MYMYVELSEPAYKRVEWGQSTVLGGGFVILCVLPSPPPQAR